MIETLLISLTLLVVFSLFLSNQYDPDLLYIYAQGDSNPLSSALSHIFGNITKAFNGLTGQSEYTVSLDGKQIFPNSTLKENIVDKYQPSTYDIRNLKYNLLGFDVAASYIKIHVNPSRIDITKTRVDIPLMLARDVTVRNGVINLNYNQVDLGSIYGIYDKTTDKIMIHIPLAVASKYLHL
ncbi:MAG TPA: hypothetical protein VFI73_11355 [Candidatus Nitrosopolaris sp.]|nr:hypothetical protein [Candidatus Nitrosopolaris sp.]